METVVTVKEIRGKCPTYKSGDSFTLKAGYQLVSDSPVCMHGLAALMPYYNALRVSEPAQWGFVLFAVQSPLGGFGNAQGVIIGHQSRQAVHADGDRKSVV